MNDHAVSEFPDHRLLNHMKCNEVLAQIVDHLIGDLGLAQHFACKSILRKSDDPAIVSHRMV